jgi:GT2 family glycosyltransferase
MIIRREAFSRVGLFAEEFGPGTPAKSGDDKYFFHATLSAGFRIVQEPRRQVWHQHRADFAALKQVMNDYGVADFAFANRCLVSHRELSALRIYQWWLAHFWHDIGSWLRRRPSRMPLRLALGEMRGAASAPWRLWRSSRSRREIEPIRLPPAHDGPRGPLEIASAVVSELPRLSVTMTTYNRRDDLRLTLESLAAQEYPPDRFEVVLVVDGSTDGSAEMARTLELPYELRVFEQSNRGTAATRNRAVEAARSPLVVFLDDDIRPVPGFLSAHARAHRDGDERHMALGYCPPATANTMWEVFLRGWWEDHYRLKAQPGHKWTFIDCSEGNASMTRALFQSVGGYDEDFDGKNRHDWDLGYRLMTAGARFSFHPDAMAWHHYKTTVAAAIANQRECGRLDVLLARKHPKLIGQLPLATVARLIDCKPSSLGRRYHLASNALVERGALLPLLQLYEAFGLRRRWQHLLNQLLVRAYFLGVLDAIPARQDVVAFLEPVVRKEDVTSVPLWLDGGPMVVPGDVGKVEVTVGHGGIELATVTVLEGAGHWDWDRITRQIVDEAGEAVRLQLSLEGLDRLIGDRPDAH